MKKIKKLSMSLISLVLILSLILGCTFMAGATSAPVELQDISSLYQTYLNPSEDQIKEYPNGAMMLPINNADMNMKTTYAIHIFRQGGTKGEAKITLKSIDLSAEYGNDYELFTSYDNFSKAVEGKANPFYGIENLSYIPTVTKTETEYIDAKEKKDTDTLRNIISQNNDDTLEKMPVSSTIELSFEDKETDKVIYVRTYQSSKVTDDKQFMLTLSNPQNCMISSDVVSTFTIKETRKKPKAYVQVTDDSIGLNSEIAYVKVQRVGNVGGICDLYFNTLSGSFKAIDDYEPIAMNLTFMPGMTEIKVPVPIYSIANDGDYFSAEITSVNNAVVVQNKAKITFSKGEADTEEHENNYSINSVDDSNSNFSNIITNPLSQVSELSNKQDKISQTGDSEDESDAYGKPVTYKSKKHRGVEYLDMNEFHLDGRYVRCLGEIKSVSHSHISFKTCHGFSFYRHVTGVESDASIDFTGADSIHVCYDNDGGSEIADQGAVVINNGSPIDPNHTKAYEWMNKLKNEGRGTTWNMSDSGKNLEQSFKIGDNWAKETHQLYFSIYRTPVPGNAYLNVYSRGDDYPLSQSTYIQYKKYKLRMLTPDKQQVYENGTLKNLEVVTKCGVIDPGTKSGDRRTGKSECDIYRDEEAAFEIIYQNQFRNFTKFKGIYICDPSNYNNHSDLISLSSTSFALTRDIIKKYSSYFKNNQIVIKPVFELCNSSVTVENHDMGEYKITVDNSKCTGTITRGDETVGSISWTKSNRPNNAYIVGDTLKFESNIKYDSLKVTYTKRSADTKSGLSTAHQDTGTDPNIQINNKYFSITPNVEVKDCTPKLNIKNPDCGIYSGKDERYETRNKDGSRTVRGFTVKDSPDTIFTSLNVGNILSVSATPNPGYRAKWSYRDSVNHNTRVYYGNSFFFVVQNCFQSLDNDVTLEFEKCDSLSDVIVSGKTLVQKGDILHQPDSTTIYEPCPSATILMDNFTSTSTAKGNFTLYKHSGSTNNEAAKLKVGKQETHRALVTYNNQLYVIDVNLADAERIKNGSYDAEIKIDFKSIGVRPKSIIATDQSGHSYGGDTITLIKAVAVQFDMQFYRDNEDKGKPVNLGRWTVVNKKGTTLHTFDEEISKDSNNAHFANVLSEIIHPDDSLYVELFNKGFNSKGDKIYKSYGKYNTGYKFISTATEENITYMPDIGVYSQASRDVNVTNDGDSPKEPLADPTPCLGPFSPMFSVFGFKPIFSHKSAGKDDKGNEMFTIQIGISWSLLKDKAAKDPKWTYSSPQDRINLIKKLVNDMDEAYNNTMKDRGKFPKACKGNALGLQNSTCISFSVSFCYQSYYYRDKNSGEYRVTGSMIIVGGGGSISWSFPFVLLYVPVFAFISIEAKINFFINVLPKKKDASGNPTYLTLTELSDRTLSQTNSSVQFTPSLEVGAGIGLDCIACVKGSIQPEFVIRSNDFRDNLVQFNLQGKIGVQFLCLAFNWNKRITGKVIYPKKTNTDADSLLSGAMEDLSVSSIKLEDMEKEYYPIKEEVYSSNSNEKTLLYTQTLDKTQMCKISDNKYFVAEYCVADKEKEQTLHYAIYDNNTKEITKPQKVLDKLIDIYQNKEFENKTYVNDTKTLLDTDISITKAGNQLILAWNKFTNDSGSNIDELESLDTVTVMYDIEKDQFHDFNVISLPGKNGEEVVVAKPKLVYNEKLNVAQIFYQAQDMRNISNESTFNQLLNKPISLYTSQLDLNKEKPQWSVSTPVFVEENRVNYFDAISKDDQILLTYVSTNKPGFTLEDAPGVSLDSKVNGSFNTTNNMYLQPYSYKDGKMVKGEQVQITDEDYVVANPQLVRIKNNDIDNILVFFKSNGRYAYQNIDNILTNGTYVDKSGKTKVIKDMMQPLFISDSDDHTVNDDFIMRTDEKGNLYGLYTQTEGGQRQIWATCFDFESVDTVDKTTVLDENGEVVRDDKGNPVMKDLEHPVKLINGKWGGKNYLTTGGVAGTDSGKFKDSFDADILDDGRILLLYNAFDYTYIKNEKDEEICTESNVRLVSGEYDTVEKFEIPEEYDEIELSNEYPTNGEVVEVNMHAVNTGVNSGKDVKYNLYVNDKLYDTQTVDYFEANMAETITSYYQVPYDADPSNIKMYFTVTENNVEKARSDTYTFTKGSKIDIDEASITPLDYFTDDNNNVQFLLSAEICNNGNDYYKGGDILKFVDTDLAALSQAVNGETEENLTVYEEFGNTKVPGLEVGEKETVTFISDEIPKSVFEKAAGQDSANFQFLLVGKEDKEWDKLGANDPFTLVSMLDTGMTQAPRPYEIDEIDAEDLEICINTSSKIDAALSPYEADLYSDITYKSGDESIATVDEFGVVTGKSIGETTITLTAEDGTTEEITVTVETPYGDANKDTRVSILDTSVIQQRLANLIDEKDIDIEKANVNADFDEFGDDQLTIISATLIQQRLANIIDVFPIEQY